MASVTGTFPQYKAINHLTVEAGTFFTQFDVDHALPVAVLGSTTVDDLGLSPLRAIGQTINVGGVRFRVVGVLASQGGMSFGSVDSSILAPLSAIEGRLVAFHPDISTVRVQAEPGAKDTFDTAVESHAAHAARAGDERPERLPDRRRQLDLVGRLLEHQDADEADGRHRRHQPRRRRHRRRQRDARHRP